MKSRFALTVVLAFSLGQFATAGNWPAWRADLAGSAETTESGLPTSWSADNNVKWRTALPDRGNSTPVIWGDKVFVTQVVEDDDFRSLMCFNRKNGKLIWQKGVKYSEKEPSHRTNPYCSASPVTDGKRVIVTFASAGVFCYDMDGKLLWRRDLGRQHHTWGNASSPLLYKDLCILYHGPGPGSFMVGMDKFTGKTVWKFDEPNWKIGKRTDGFQGNEARGIVGSFNAPIIVKADGRDELIMSFPMEMRGFNPETGSELWNCKGLNPLVYCSPVYHDGVVVAMGGYYGNSMAVRIGGSGDVTRTHRLWHKVRHNGGIGSGVAKDGHIYYPNSGGTGFCVNIKTGEEIWSNKLAGKSRQTGAWGSPVLAGDTIYFMNQGGDTLVYKADTKFKQVAANPIGEKSNSSIVFSDGDVFIRTHKALWCIGKK